VKCPPCSHASPAVTVSVCLVACPARTWTRWGTINRRGQRFFVLGRLQPCGRHLATVYVDGSMPGGAGDGPAGERPVVCVRRAHVRGAFNPPKSKYGRRQVPVDHELVKALRRRSRGESDPRALVFAAPDGEPLHPSSLLKRVFKLAAEEAGVSWAGFHTLRRTCASRLFAEGRNAVQVQLWLRHADPGFTLRTYVHLLNDELGEPLSLPSKGVSAVSAEHAPSDATAVSGIEALAA
jgi:hypothetical protein